MRRLATLVEVPMSELDTERARNLMVDGQLRPNKVTDRRIIDAMRSLKRESFVTADQADFAYADGDVRLGGGRVLMKPMLSARLIQLARPQAGESALVVGSGTGYAAALLAACGVQVMALEESETLLAIARTACATEISAGRITFVQGPLAAGHPAGAPYDLVLIDGAVRDIPPVIGRQVAATGRLVTVVAPAGAVGVAVLAEPSVGGLRARQMFDANTALLPELLPVPGFVF